MKWCVSRDEPRVSRISHIRYNSQVHRLSSEALRHALAAIAKHIPPLLITSFDDLLTYLSALMTVSWLDHMNLVLSLLVLSLLPSRVLSWLVFPSFPLLMMISNPKE